MEYTTPPNQPTGPPRSVREAREALPPVQPRLGGPPIADVFSPSSSEEIDEELDEPGRPGPDFRAGRLPWWAAYHSPYLELDFGMIDSKDADLFKLDLLYRSLWSAGEPPHPSPTKLEELWKTFTEKYNGDPEFEDKVMRDHKAHLPSTPEGAKYCAHMVLYENGEGCDVPECSSCYSDSFKATAAN